MKKTYIWVIIFVLLVIGLFELSKYLRPHSADEAKWLAAGVECSPMEGEAEHFHPHLDIFVDGVQEKVPAEIGITSTCLAEIHTHDQTGDDVGKIHIESPHAGKPFTFGQFFVVWGKTIERDGYDVSMTVNGTPSTELGNLKLEDLQQIVLNYTKKGTAIISDLVHLSSPVSGAVVTSPLLIKGAAVGAMYFEAVFPVMLKDGSGKVIAQGQAHADGDWMQTGFVPFTATLTFTKPATATGTLVFKNDNPSGLPANDKIVEFPVKF